MLKFMAGEGINPKLANRIKYGFVIFSACCLGYLGGKIQWENKKDWCNSNSLTQYQCEDQINTLIEKTGKPAVIYYYLPATLYHHLFRSFMFKYSNKYPQNATWVMVNLTKNLQQAKEALSTVVYPNNYSKIEVRFPKGELAIFENDSKEGLKLIKQVNGNRRQVYNYHYSQNDFRAFLEQHKVISGEDPLLSVLNLTQKSLFKNQ